MFIVDLSILIKCILNFKQNSTNRNNYLITGKRQTYFDQNMYYTFSLIGYISQFHVIKLFHISFITCMYYSNRKIYVISAYTNIIVYQTKWISNYNALKELHNNRFAVYLIHSYKQ